MRTLNRIVTLVSFFLMVIGAINWLLVGISRFDLVRWLFGRKLPGRIAYGLVGAAGLAQLSEFAWSLWHGKRYPAMQ